MIGFLDLQVIEKFKEFQESEDGRQYSDLDIHKVEFEEKSLFQLVSLSNGSEFPSGYVKRGDVQGNIPLISAGTKNDIMGNIKSLQGNNKDYPNKHYVFNNTKSKWNEVEHYIGKDYYTLTADGVYGGTLILRKFIDYPKGFYTTNVCKVVSFIDTNIFESYFLYAYKIEKDKHKFGFIIKANNDNLSKVIIPIPNNLNTKYSSYNIQKVIVEFLEYSFNSLEKIQNNIDTQQHFYQRLNKSLIPSTFNKECMKKTFSKYAQEHNIGFEITDVDFEIKRIHTNKQNKDKLICKKRMGFTPQKDANGTINWFSVKDLGQIDGLFINNYTTNDLTTMNLIKEMIDKSNTGKSEKLVPIQKGDILISFKLTVGVVKIYNSQEPAYCNEAIDILTVNSDIYNKYVAYNCMLEYPKYGTKTNNGLTLNDDSKKEIKIFIPKPMDNYTSYEIQEIIADFIEYEDTKIVDNFKKQKLAYNGVVRYKKAYLARTFSLINWSKNG